MPFAAKHGSAGAQHPINLLRDAIDTMIRFTIQRKVFLATFLLSTLLVVLLALVVRWNLGQGFERYVTAAEFARLDWLVRKVETEFAANGNWEFLRDPSGQAWRRLLRSPQWRGSPPLSTPPPQGLGRDAAPPPNDTLRLGPRIGLRDAQGQPLAGAKVHAVASNANTSITQRPILYQGAAVGYLTLQPATAALDALDVTFITSQNRNLLVAAVSALMLSALAAWLLSRHLLLPIGELRDGASRIAQGHLDARIVVHGQDELGDLAATFNTMARRLDDLESSRRKWIADTSHELRTPLAVLRAEIEALQDGVHSPDGPTLERMHRQTSQLTQLVDDLRLTLERQADAKFLEPTRIAPIGVLLDSVASFQKRFDQADIALDSTGVTAAWQSLAMLGNAGRLQQVFDNLLENSLRYTHAGGQLVITAQVAPETLTLHFDDTPPAPPQAALPHLFERLFRADTSRSRALGGTGLGLAICKAMVDAHGGSIEADFSKLGGLQVTVSLPLQSPSTPMP